MRVFLNFWPACSLCEDCSHGVNMSLHGENYSFAEGDVVGCTKQVELESDSGRGVAMICALKDLIPDVTRFLEADTDNGESASVDDDDPITEIFPPHQGPGPKMTLPPMITVFDKDAW